MAWMGTDPSSASATLGRRASSVKTTVGFTSPNQSRISLAVERKLKGEPMAPMRITAMARMA